MEILFVMGAFLLPFCMSKIFNDMANITFYNNIQRIKNERF